MATVTTNKTSTDLPQHDDLEKPNVRHDEIINSMSASEQKRLIRRIDTRLVITLGCLYCISLLDRTNMGAASVAGMQKDLNMNAANNGYSITSLVFFITYTIFQIPATAIIRKIGPRIFISTIVLLWGAVMIAFGFAPTWPVMAGLRVILGALEAGFYPGCIFLLSTWYPRYELQKRNAVFYLIGSMASGLGGILAYGLMQMDGISGRTGWEWIFISWNFLNESEAAFIVARLEADRSDVYSEPFSLKSYLSNAADSKVWAYSLLYLLTTANTYSIAFFLPIILQESMGFSVAKAQCLVAPPYAAAALVMFVQAIFADKWRIRGPVVAFNAAMGLVGLALMGYLESPAPRYFGIFLATIAGEFSSFSSSGVLFYAVNNIRGQWKRAFTSATLIGGGSIGGIFGTTVFRAQDAPNYHPGLLATMLANAAIILIVAAMSFKFSRANKRAEGGGKIIEGLAGFRYTL
ncbi:phthalate transporter [Penicillium cosmopolitanum]|uniref:Phthalate transporter n=1 Tax=Penicillium cosmopolitanum TaxID=1131564 RepID=A0A9W9SK13_9EURO|nr:phthalate transporter [Penicillium cosmopolitanum]KAJ5379380.1 phthalate transporter [Penicillium cosmopolitanum]